ncbi:MAG: L,D-transpeptidase, partial [Clostridia bacterium]|nr:L,D-transpeptidase [Clostridia bacterium]
MKHRTNTVRRLTVLLLFMVTVAATWQYPLHTQQRRTVATMTAAETQSGKNRPTVVEKHLSALSHPTPLAADEVAQTLEDRMGFPHTGHPAVDKPPAGHTVQREAPVSSTSTKTSHVTSGKTTSTTLTTVTTVATVTSATSGKTSTTSSSTAKTTTTTKANENGNGGNAYIKNPDYRSRYYIVVYTGSQSAVVYGKDNDGQYTRLIKSFTVSTGLKNSSPTRTGVYKIRAK